MRIPAGRRRIEVSNPDKVLFPDDGYTKGDLVRYYAAVADDMLPFVRDRLMTMERYPDGITGKRFFNKDAPSYFPSWIRTERVPKKNGTVDHVVCDDKATLLYIANQACITPHVAQHPARDLEHPDRLVMDLDPSTPDFSVVVRAALATRDLFEGLGLVPFVKTSGGRGLHIFVPLRGGSTFTEVKAFARSAARALADEMPDEVTTEHRKSERGDRLFADWLRNSYGQTVVATFGVRARSGAPVSMPLDWSEVTADLDPTAYNIETAPERIAAGDPWKGWRRRARSLAGPARRLARRG